MMRGTYAAIDMIESDRRRDANRAKKYPELLNAASLLREALQQIWEGDDMCWILPGKVYKIQCGSCNGEADTKEDIIHEEGCLQGVMYKAIMAFDKL